MIIKKNRVFTFSLWGLNKSVMKYFKYICNINKKNKKKKKKKKRKKKKKKDVATYCSMVSWQSN